MTSHHINLQWFIQVETLNNQEPKRASRYNLVQPRFTDLLLIESLIFTCPSLVDGALTNPPVLNNEYTSSQLLAAATSGVGM